MSDTEAAFESIASLSARIGSGRLSPVKYTEELLGRIAALDERLRSFIRIMPERALAQARAAESAMKSGAGLGILHGIPYAAKDLFDVKGTPTTAGTHLRAHSIARQDCTPVGQTGRRWHGSPRQDPYRAVRLRRAGHQS